MVGDPDSAREPKPRCRRPTDATIQQDLNPISLEIAVNSKWPKVMLMSAATSAWLIYDMATATEAPRQALAILQDRKSVV